MPSLAVTGHTSGIGAAAAAHFAAKGWSVKGFSRRNGYDVGADAARVVAEARGCDVFLNNAHKDAAQVELLYALWELWKDEDKLIVNLGSLSSEGIIPQQGRYPCYKAALDKACEQLQSVPSSCRVVNLRPGLVDTPMTAHREGRKLAPADVVRVLDWVVSQPADFYVKDVSFRVRRPR